MAVITFDEFLPKVDSEKALTFDEFLLPIEPEKLSTSTNVLTCDEFLPKEEPTETKPPSKYLGVGETLKREGGKFYKGYKISASSFYNTLANIPGLVDKVNTKIAEFVTKEKPPEGEPINALKITEDYLRSLAQSVAPTAEEINDKESLIEKLYVAIGATPVTLGEYILPTKKLGSVAGMALVDALRESDKGGGNT